MKITDSSSACGPRHLQPCPNSRGLPRTNTSRGIPRDDCGTRAECQRCQAWRWLPQLKPTTSWTAHFTFYVLSDLEPNASVVYESWRGTDSRPRRARRSRPKSSELTEMYCRIALDPILLEPRRDHSVLDSPLSSSDRLSQSSCAVVCPLPHEGRGLSFCELLRPLVVSASLYTPDILAMALQRFLPIDIVGRFILSLCIIS